MHFVNVNRGAHALQDAYLLPDLHTAHFFHLLLGHHIKKAYTVCKLKNFLNQERVDEIDQRAVCILQTRYVAKVYIILVIVKQLGQESLGVDARVPNYEVFDLIYYLIIDYFFLPFLFYHLSLLVWYVDCKCDLFHFEGLWAFQQR